MNDALVNTLVFVFVFGVVPWGMILALRLVGRRRGYEDVHAPPSAGPAPDPPLRCRLNLSHRWRTIRTLDGGRYQRCLDCWKSRDMPTVGPPP